MITVLAAFAIVLAVNAAFAVYLLADYRRERGVR